MPRPKTGDRIKITGTMINDPAPIEIGTTGTVVSVDNVGTQFEQVDVDWDPEPRSGAQRSLLLTTQDYSIIEIIT